MTARLQRGLASPLEIVRRARGRRTGRLRSLPVLALEAHSACNCRCVMCDIWKANAAKREISVETLDRHAADIARLQVRRVMLTGGEPLMHSNLWALCDRLRRHRTRITLLSTGLGLREHAARIVRVCDDLVVSLDGSRDVHDRVRRVPGAFDRMADGMAAIRAHSPWFPVVGRSVIQKMNYADLPHIVEAAKGLSLDRVSFLAADVSTPAFNRPQPWADDRRAEIALDRDDLPRFAATIEDTLARRGDDFASGFIEQPPAGLWRIHGYYAALAGLAPFPPTRCNAPWISAVLDADGALRPCFFHQPYGNTGQHGLEAVLNSPAAVEFRRTLDVAHNATCSRCVCTLRLPLTREP